LVAGQSRFDKAKVPPKTDWDAAGTVSGAPKIRAVQIIADLEGTTRGSHGGCVRLFQLQGQSGHLHHQRLGLFLPLIPHPACGHPLPLSRARENGAAQGRQSLRASRRRLGEPLDDFNASRQADMPRVANPRSAQSQRDCGRHEPRTSPTF